MGNPDLHSKVNNWLTSQGYPLEMILAKSFAKKGFSIEQPYHFKDPETNTIREVDMAISFFDVIGLINIYFVVECKKSNKPWVIFSSEHNQLTRLNSFCHMTNNSRRAVANNLVAMLELPWFKKPERLGYGMVQALGSGNDQCYKALMSAAKGAISYFKDEKVAKQFMFVFPLVVLDSTLFESYIDESGKNQLISVDSGYIHFRVPISQYFGTTVRIITKDYINKLIEEIEFMYSFLKKTLSVQLKQADQELFKMMSELDIKCEDQNQNEHIDKKKT